MLQNKKIVVTQPGVVEIVKEELDETKIGEGELLVRKLYTLVSAGTETACIAGKEAWFEFPDVLGYSAVGEIIAVGAAVKEHVPGDKIFFPGLHSAYEVISKDEQIIKIEGADPDNLKYIPFIRMGAISSTAIRVSNIEFGDNVLVVGQGLIGLMAMQEARLQGARVIAVDTSVSRLAVSKRLGADYIFQAGTCDLQEEISKATNGEMVSSLIDATGSARVIYESIPLVQKNGEVILLGSPRDSWNGNITQILKYVHLCRSNVELKGAHEFKYPVKRMPYVKHSAERTLEILMQYIENGRFQVKPMLTHLVKPEEGPVIYNELAAGEESYLGIVYDWTADVD